MGRNPSISPATGSAEELERHFRKPSLKAWDSSMDTAHSEKWKALGSCPADLVGYGNFKIGQNKESQCEKPFRGTLNADGEHIDFVGH